MSIAIIRIYRRNYNILFCVVLFVTTATTLSTWSCVSTMFAELRITTTTAWSCSLIYNHKAALYVYRVMGGTHCTNHYMEEIQLQNVCMYLQMREELRLYDGLKRDWDRERLLVSAHTLPQISHTSHFLATVISNRKPKITHMYQAYFNE